MYHLFDNFITDKKVGFKSYKLYISQKEYEYETIENLLHYAMKSTDSKGHADFIKKYMNIFNEHIQLVNSLFNSLSILSNELLDHLNENNVTGEITELSELKYYLHLDLDSYFFFTPLGFDKFLEKKYYGIFEVKETKKGFIISQTSIGYSNISTDELRKHPSYLENHINNFYQLETIDEVNEHKEYCKKLLMKYFRVRDRYEVFKLEDSALSKVLGSPLKLLRKINSNYNERLIKICLIKNDSTIRVTPELVKLILNERKILSKNEYKDILDDSFEEFCTTIQQLKNELMDDLSLSQDTLDRYMSYLPDDF